MPKHDLVSLARGPARFDRLSRRRMLQLGAAAAAGAALGPAVRGGAAEPTLTQVAPKDRKLLFIFCAFGGASIIDSFLPIAESDVGDATLSATLNVFPDSLVELVPGSNLRNVGLLADSDYSFYVKPANMGELLRRHGQDAAVITHDVSSVNHAIGQQRSLNGAGINAGRTLMEAMAVRYGGGMSLPACNMARGGFIEQGSDPTLPLRARHELISSPLLFAMGTHGYRGIAGLPAGTAVERARGIREQLDRESVFAQTFGKSARLQTYLKRRESARSDFEAADVIDKLLLLEPGSIDPRLGLMGSEIVSVLREKLPVMEIDEVQAQLALGFLLTYHGMSTSIAVGLREDPPIVEKGPLNTPIAFDFSHTNHRMTQSIMWGRTASLLDTFISLLKQYDYMGDPALGKMWDRSLIYVASEFGRGKTRPDGSSSWSTAHDLNNGSLIISPLIKGNRVYGGVDPKSGKTYGFDPTSGLPDPAAKLFEGDVYSLLAHALDIPFAGRRDFPAVVRG
jgi:hypothetical protein